MNHILVDKIKQFNRKSIETPHGFIYDLQLGFWTSFEDHGSSLVKNPNLRVLMQGSKKEDVETGEDQKGK
jgi:hypothetical protein